MYTHFYGLQEEPFRLTPDPKFLYLSHSHREGLAHLLDGIARKHSPLVLTGDIGTGKTTLIYSLLARLDPSTHTALLVNSHVTFPDLLQQILYELGLGLHPPSSGELWRALQQFLTHCQAVNETVLVILDEAQNFSAGMLEALRLLTNIGSASETCLQLILVGHQGLWDTLRVPQLAPLRQRIGGNYQLLPISYPEVLVYIATRLAVAGATRPLFTADAVEAIYAWSKGIPRLINIMCDLALFFGCVAQQPTIGPTLIQQVQASLTAPTPAAPPAARPRLARPPARMDASIIRQVRRTLRTEPTPPSATRGAMAPRNPRAVTRGRARRRALTLRLGGVLVGLLCGVLLWDQHEALVARLARWSHAVPPPVLWEPSPPPAREPSAAIGSRTPQESTAPRSPQPSAALAEQGSTVAEPPVTEALSSTSQPDLGRRQRGAAETRAATDAPQSVIVHPGETWATILRRAYGRSDRKIRRRVVQANPGLSARGRLKVGQRITLPPLPQVPPQQ